VIGARERLLAGRKNDRAERSLPFRLTCKLRTEEQSKGRTAKIDSTEGKEDSRQGPSKTLFCSKLAFSWNQEGGQKKGAFNGLKMKSSEKLKEVNQEEEVKNKASIHRQFWQPTNVSGRLNQIKKSDQQNERGTGGHGLIKKKSEPEFDQGPRTTETS